MVHSALTYLYPSAHGALFVLYVTVLYACINVYVFN